MKDEKDPQKFTLVVYNCAEDEITRILSLPLDDEDDLASEYIINDGYPTLILEYKVNEKTKLTTNVKNRF